MKKKTMEAIRKYCTPALRVEDGKPGRRKGFFAESITHEWAATDSFSGIIFYGMMDQDAEEAVPYGKGMRIEPVNLNQFAENYENRSEYPNDAGLY